MTSLFELVLSKAVVLNHNKMFLRIVRLLKLTKLIRVFRAIRFLKEMRQFFGCLTGCTMSLFWALMMIGLVLLVFALFFVQAMASYLHEIGDGPFEKVAKEDILDSFGSVFQACLTLMEIACGYGEWGEQYDIVRVTGRLNGVMFVFFTLFFTVAVWNIVTSIFLENTLKMATPDRESELLEKLWRDVEDAKELTAMLERADLDKSGMLSREEVSRFLCEDSKFRGFFETRGIDIKNAEVFFEMLASASPTNEVDLEAFVASCLRVKGPATSIDLHTLAFESKMMHKVQKRFNTFVAERFKALDEKISKLGLHFRVHEPLQGRCRPQPLNLGPIGHHEILVSGGEKRQQQKINGSSEEPAAPPVSVRSSGSAGPMLSM
eukprot:TRINITY_DN28339_c0_g1_i2.p1 TRINITY_DN28339_c0_g1~~TRINITY_DN28339_c0_g1_i2.p1  ORF type:complete len:378 (+),score=67.11 TRINITY_DN28339_c0_g1_i2:979-2112(+)